MPARIEPGGGKGQEKIWRNAVERAVKRTAAGDDTKALEILADKLVSVGKNGDVPALKEIGDRLDGKPSQSIEVAATVRFERIAWEIVPAIDITPDNVTLGAATGLTGAIDGEAEPDDAAKPGPDTAALPTIDSNTDNQAEIGQIAKPLEDNDTGAGLVPEKMKPEGE